MSQFVAVSIDRFLNRSSHDEVTLMKTAACKPLTADLHQAIDSTGALGCVTLWLLPYPRV